MSKRPAFQFYPSDWRTDQDLRMCSSGARGLWIDMLCLMHEGEPYGHLTAKGKPMPVEALAKLVGEPAPAARRWLSELREHEVFSETEEGIIFSRRMARDEQVREARAAGGPEGGAHGKKGGAFGHLGGRPKKDKGGSGGSQTGDKKTPLEPPPSSSSSSPPSEDYSVPDGTGGSAPSEALEQFRALDAAAKAWGAAKFVLSTLGGVTAAKAGDVIGKWKRDHKLTDAEIFDVAEATWRAQTRDPIPYMARTAADIAGRRGLPGIFDAPPERQRAWMAEFVEKPNGWRPGDRGPRPGHEGCRVHPDIQREFGIEPYSPGSRSAA